MFFYSDTQATTFTGAISQSADATKHFLTHYANSLALAFFANHPESKPLEKVQAAKELVICERKMNFWKRHPMYETRRAETGMIALKKHWA